MAYLDIVMVFESIFDMVKELKDVESIEAAVQKSVHALKSGLPDVQPVVHRVLERTHFNLACAKENLNELGKNGGTDKVRNGKIGKLNPPL